MGEDRFDVIIVGAGLAGCVAAYQLAKNGLEVLVVEKGNYSGAKNMTGGRLYGHSLEKLIPGFAKTAPVERMMTKERYSFQVDGERMTVDYPSSAVTTPGGASYSVLRGKLDTWLAERAEEQGATMIYGVRVDDLLMRDSTVCGVVAGDETLDADVVILADGVNSLLSQKLGMKPELLPTQAVVGVKEVIELDTATIEARFGLTAGEGLTWIWNGCCTDDGVCDGFLYTNKDSISLGITMRVDNILRTERSVPELLEDFKNNAEILPLIEGGKLAEYSAHLIPEGGAEMIPRIYGDGVLICGDAAALTANLGFTIRGMDLAVESGRLAAETVLAARKAGDFSETALASYQSALEESFVMPCMRGGEACKRALNGASLRRDPAQTICAAMVQAHITGHNAREEK